MRVKASLIATAAASALLLAGCEATYRGHGYAPVAEELAGIQPGIDTQLDVIEQIGRPGGIGLVEDDAWYYVASTVEHMTYQEPKVVDRRIVVVLFDEAGTVEDVRQFGIEDGQVIDLVTRTTPTFGRELTVVQQLLGNILNIGAQAGF
ncbi:MAG: outer membrane protein assembly factor BamE [Pseudomonadota bacterium]